MVDSREVQEETKVSCRLADHFIFSVGEKGKEPQSEQRMQKLRDDMEKITQETNPTRRKVLQATFKRRYLQDSSRNIIKDPSENEILKQKLNDFSTVIDTVDDPPISKTEAAKRIASSSASLTAEEKTSLKN